MFDDDPSVLENVMATSSMTVVVPQRQLEDPLAHLPRSSISEFHKGQVIYNQDLRPASSSSSRGK
jgi:hypothetical protein